MDDNETSTVLHPNNLCLALAAANETIGMGIYLEFARKRFYESAAQLKSRMEDSTYFVCLEELTKDPDQLEGRIRSFLLKLQNEQRISNATIITQGDRNRTRVVLADKKGHSTDHNPVLRDRLRAIAMELDCTYFGCETILSL